MAETTAQRYARDWMSVGDDRKVRGFDYRKHAEVLREYNDTGVAGTNNVVGTLDRVPAGFVQATFEATLAYNPNA